MRKGCAGHLEIAILPLEPHFVRKGCAGHLANRKFTSFFGDRTSFRAKGLRGTTLKSQFYLSFWRSNLISCERVAPDTLKSQFYLSFWRSNLISCERVAFRAVSLALSCPRLQKRNRKEGEGKRARGQEEKMWGQEGKRQEGKRRRCEDVRMWRCEDVRMRRCEDEQMWRCEDVKMSRCEDEKMWRCEDVKMRRCEDEKMWRWENEIQTPTIGRTLRSDALGKKNENRDANKFPLARAIQNNRKTQFHTGFLSWGFHIMSLINARPYP